MNNFAGRTIWTGDNPDILRGLNSAAVDLIYLYPPFDSNRNAVSERRRDITKSLSPSTEQLK